MGEGIEIWDPRNRDRGLGGSITKIPIESFGLDCTNCNFPASFLAGHTLVGFTARRRGVICSHIGYLECPSTRFDYV